MTRALYPPFFRLVSVLLFTVSFQLPAHADLCRDLLVGQFGLDHNIQTEQIKGTKLANEEKTGRKPGKLRTAIKSVTNIFELNATLEYVTDPNSEKGSRIVVRSAISTEELQNQFDRKMLKYEKRSSPANLANYIGPKATLQVLPFLVMRTLRKLLEISRLSFETAYFSPFNTKIRETYRLEKIQESALTEIPELKTAWKAIEEQSTYLMARAEAVHKKSLAENVSSEEAQRAQEEAESILKQLNIIVSHAKATIKEPLERKEKELAELNESKDHQVLLKEMEDLLTEILNFAEEKRDLIGAGVVNSANSSMLISTLFQLKGVWGKNLGYRAMVSVGREKNVNKNWDAATLFPMKLELFRYSKTQNLFYTESVQVFSFQEIADLIKASSAAYTRSIGYFTTVPSLLSEAFKVQKIRLEKSERLYRELTRRKSQLTPYLENLLEKTKDVQYQVENNGTESHLMVPFYVSFYIESLMFMEEFNLLMKRTNPDKYIGMYAKAKNISFEQAKQELEVYNVMPIIKYPVRFVANVVNFSKDVSKNVLKRYASTSFIAMLAWGGLAPESFNDTVASATNWVVEVIEEPVQKPVPTVRPNPYIYRPVPGQPQQPGAYPPDHPGSSHQPPPAQPGQQHVPGPRRPPSTTPPPRPGQGVDEFETDPLEENGGWTTFSQNFATKYPIINRQVIQETGLETEKLVEEEASLVDLLDAKGAIGELSQLKNWLVQKHKAVVSAVAAIQTPEIAPWGEVLKTQEFDHEITPTSLPGDYKDLYNLNILVGQEKTEAVDAFSTRAALFISDYLRVRFKEELSQEQMVQLKDYYITALYEAAQLRKEIKERGRFLKRFLPAHVTLEDLGLTPLEQYLDSDNPKVGLAAKKLLEDRIVLENQWHSTYSLRTDEMVFNRLINKRKQELVQLYSSSILNDFKEDASALKKRILELELEMARKQLEDN